MCTAQERRQRRRKRIKARERNFEARSHRSSSTLLAFCTLQEARTARVGASAPFRWYAHRFSRHLWSQGSDGLSLLCLAMWTSAERPAAPPRVRTEVGRDRFSIAFPADTCPVAHRQVDQSGRAAAGSDPGAADQAGRGASKRFFLALRARLADRVIRRREAQLTHCAEDGVGHLPADIRLDPSAARSDRPRRRPRRAQSRWQDCRADGQGRRQGPVARVRWPEPESWRGCASLVCDSSADHAQEYCALAMRYCATADASRSLVQGFGDPRSPQRVIRLAHRSVAPRISICNQRHLFTQY